MDKVCERLVEVIKLRDKYLYAPNKGHLGMAMSNEEVVDMLKTYKENKYKFPKSILNDYKLDFKNGVMQIYNKKKQKNEYEVNEFEEYLDDLNKVLDLRAFGPCKSFCYKRLQILLSRFTLHYWLNSDVEKMESKAIPYRDFYNVRKIDNHIHHSLSNNIYLYIIIL